MPKQPCDSIYDNIAVRTRVNRAYNRVYNVNRNNEHVCLRCGSHNTAGRRELEGYEVICNDCAHRIVI